MRNRALLAILFANFVGGISYLMQKLALDGLPPTTITLGRNLVALVAMLIWARSRGGIQWKSTRREHLLMFLLGTMSFTLPMLLGVIGTEKSTAANGSIMILLEPGVILLLSWWLLKEHVSWKQVLGVGLGLVGATIIVLKDAPISGLLVEEHLEGNLILILHGILWGTFTPIARILTRTKKPLDVTLISMCYGFVILLPGTVIESAEWHTGPHLLQALVWILVLGVLVTWLGTYMWNFAASILRGKTIAPFLFLQPVAGAASSWLVLGEELSTGTWIGSLIIAGGVMLVIGTGTPEERESDRIADAERAG